MARYEHQPWLLADHGFHFVLFMHLFCTLPSLQVYSDLSPSTEIETEILNTQIMYNNIRDAVANTKLSLWVQPEYDHGVLITTFFARLHGTDQEREHSL